ncbi:MAG: SLC13 family permease, partial [Syntrophobacteraceae bacterium]|nr:SLC13 family permease [Syntrophobacteraceae bacterium]
MTDLQVFVTPIIFAGVILCIAFNVLDIVLAALIGVSTMLLFGVFTSQEFLNAVQTAGGPISLLFGGMVVARTLVPTGLFDLLGTHFLRVTGGSGKRFLLGIVIMTAPVCAFLPNATVVILLATLVGDPATFLVGSSIGMSFGEYLRKVSLGGLLSVLVIIPVLPWLMKDIWQTKRSLPADLPLPRLDRPLFCVLALLVLVVMVLLFLVGEKMPAPLLPPSVAIVGASLALLVIYGVKVEPIDKVLKDVDWSTLLFLMCMFLMVEAITRTGILQSVSHGMYGWFGTQLHLVAMAMLVGVALASGFLAN